MTLAIIIRVWVEDGVVIILACPKGHMHHVTWHSNN
jgi:hypothetical protein